MKFLLLLILKLCVLGVTAQYTYFNNTYGEFGDQETEVISNVVVVGDIIYLFGGIDNDQDPFSFLLRAIDNQGETIIENTVPINNSLTLIGDCQAVSPINPNKFVYTQATVQGELKGYVTIYDELLDTVWMKTYNLFSSQTYFRSNIVDESGIIILGEDASFSNATGTFILKIDFDGNIVWSNLLHNVNEEMVHVNENVITLTDGYLLGGNKQGQFTAMLTKTDLEGNVEWEYYADNFENDEGEQADTRAYRLAQLPNGDIVGAHMVWYEYYGTQPWNNQDPSWYRSLHLSKINLEDSITTYWEHNYFTDQEFSGSNLWKILPTEDNGVIAMGANEVYAENAWVAKIDSSGALEWFNFYSLDISQTQETYYPYDIEQTSDGGYIIVGEYFSYNEDNFKKSWVMKIDACGDTQRQGCDYVGIQESIQSKQFKIYPNPANTYFQLEGKTLSVGDRIEVIDMYGRVVIQEEWIPNGMIDIDELSSGLYQVIVYNKSGSFYSKSLVVE